MFKHFVAVVTMISTAVLLPNSIRRAEALTTPISAPPREKKLTCTSCKTNQGTTRLDALENLATLGRRTQPTHLTPIQRSGFEGVNANFVSTATGHLSFAVTDLRIHGPIPLMFQRIYSSERSEDSGLGSGWSFLFDDRIYFDGVNASVTTSAGSVANLRLDRDTGRFTRMTDDSIGPQSLILADSNTITEVIGDFTRTYRKLGDAYRLSNIADSTGNSITVSFDGRGNVAQIANSGGAFISLEWSSDKDARLLAISDHTKRRVRYQQDAKRLRSVTDSAGASWAYRYEAGRLATALDPLNRTLIQARYDKAGHVVEIGDGLGQSAFEYRFTSGGISSRTVLTDPIGNKSVLEHTDRGALASAGYAGEQPFLRIEYNAASRPVHVSNTMGDDTNFVYDGQNRLVRKTSSNGTYETYTYDERGHLSSSNTNGVRTDYVRDSLGNILRAKSSDSGKSYEARRDSRGRSTKLVAESGREIALEYDAYGNTSGITVNRGERFQIEHDTAGRVVSRGSVRYEYDARGSLAKEADAQGRSLALERDASGAITGVINGNGAWVRAIRDTGGRIVSLSSSTGKTRRFAYDARGALIDYTDANGEHKKLEYDGRGRVRSITDNDGNKSVIERDGKGRLIGITRLTGNLWKDLRGGRLIALKRGLRAAQHPRVELESRNHRASLDPQDWNDECMFGSDGFDPILTYTFTEFGCDDPFEMFGSSDPFGEFGGGGGLLDPFFQPLSESCPECVARQTAICALRTQSCVWEAIGNRTAGGVACIGVALVNVLLGVACGLITLSSLGFSGVACQITYQACLLETRDKCPSCR